MISGDDAKVHGAAAANYTLLAQLDRVFAYEAKGQWFESIRECQYITKALVIGH